MKVIHSFAPLGSLAIILITACSEPREQVQVTPDPKQVEETISETSIVSEPTSSAEPESKSIAVSWKPAEACNYLESLSGYTTRGYKDLFADGNWSCSSPYKEIGSSPLPNNTAYYADGDRSEVNKLRLVANYNDASTSGELTNELVNASKLLMSKATGKQMPDEVESSLRSGASGNWSIEGTSVAVEREDWTSGKGYSTSFSLIRD